MPLGKELVPLLQKGGHLDILKYAHENGCPWDKSTCSSAARGGHLEILKFARDNGCPWDGQTLAHAKWEGHSVILEWAKENGCPDRWDTDSEYIEDSEDSKDDD
ncbi:ankyrin repeat protein [Seminavis robusta]|uniref:Ankyrin repeat protein n=1 Tax=Seminavis robusta TaxID=568900 RepID=A0A9N8HJQ1_9STRA|nr:ankyrin repeat protein [Seminavis robusta]|eukprot:Sro702_g190040.1 ankyrin repeat protein (104) ;mRNA; f:50784-51095